VRLWRFRRKPKHEHYLGEYTEPSFRGAFFMLVFSIVLVVLVWLAYGWALGQTTAPNVQEVPNPNGLFDGGRGMLAALSLT
jgi:hypothetical protein